MLRGLSAEIDDPEAFRAFTDDFPAVYGSGNNVLHFVLDVRRERSLID